MGSVPRGASAPGMFDGFADPDSFPVLIIRRPTTITLFPNRSFAMVNLASQLPRTVRSSSHPMDGLTRRTNWGTRSRFSRWRLSTRASGDF